MFPFLFSPLFSSSLDSPGIWVGGFQKFPHFRGLAGRRWEGVFLVRKAQSSLSSKICGREWPYKWAVTTQWLVSQSAPGDWNGWISKLKTTHILPFSPILILVLRAIATTPTKQQNSSWNLVSTNVSSFGTFFSKILWANLWSSKSTVLCERRETKASKTVT